jgi:hypothetical protein
LQRLAVILCIDQGTADFGEGFQSVAHRVCFVGDPRVGIGRYMTFYNPVS